MIERTPDNNIPGFALLLGVAGLIPFGVGALATWFAEGFLQAQAWYALATYGAVILSFLGGVHWGVALTPAADSSTPGYINRLIISVVPSLVGWAALLMPTRTGLYAMAMAFVVMLWTDWNAGRAGRVPQWYFQLRWPLTMVVVCCLVAGAMA